MTDVGVHDVGGPGRSEGNAAPFLHATVAQLGMELRLTARRGENLLVTLVIPVVVLLFFATFPVGDTGGRPVDFVLPGVLALAVISTSLVNLGISTAYERSYGVLKRLGGTPLPRAGLIAAKIGTVVIIELLQLAILAGTAMVVLGWQLGPGANAGLVSLALVLGSLAFAGLGMWMAGSLRAETVLAGANALFLAFLLVGGIVVPVDRLPAALADLARLLPADALAEALRAGTGTPGVDAGGPLAVLTVWAVVAVAAAVVRFRWE